MNNLNKLLLARPLIAVPARSALAAASSRAFQSAAAGAVAYNQHHQRLTEEIDASKTTSLGDRDPTQTKQEPDFGDSSLMHDHVTAMDSHKTKSTHLSNHMQKSKVNVRRLFDKYLSSKFRCDPGKEQRKIARELLRSISADIVAREIVMLPLLSQARDQDGGYSRFHQHEQVDVDWKDEMQRKLEVIKTELSELEGIDPHSTSFDESVRRVVMVYEENLAQVPDLSGIYPAQGKHAGTKFSTVRKLATEQMEEKGWISPAHLDGLVLAFDQIISSESSESH